MDPQSDAPVIIHSSRSADSQKQDPWTSARSFSAVKTCVHCGNQFRPWSKTTDGKRVVCQEAIWKKQEFCSISCSKKKRNPMHKKSVREKMAERLREIRHKPSVRGGNGRPPSLTELGLLFLLGDGWEWSRPVATGVFRSIGCPNHYKLDISNESLMICIEVDGPSHHSREDQDERKTEVLTGLGWKVLRVSKVDAERLYTTFTSQDILLTSLGVC